MRPSWWVGAHLQSKDLFWPFAVGEQRHILGGDSGRAQPRRDRRGRQILGLHALERLDIAGKGRVEGGGFACRPKLGAHRARMVTV